MSLNLIIVLLFVLMLISAAVFYRNSTLDKLPPLNGEKILFEESGVRACQNGSPRSVIFINCIVRVTNIRIIIAQKMLFSKRHALRHVILLNGLSDSTDLKTSLRKGYLNITISRSDLKISDTDGITTVRIDIPASALTKGQFITFNTSGKEYFSNFL